MKKFILIVLTCTILIPSVSSKSLCKFETQKYKQNDDVDIKIYAGVLRDIESRIGLGWVVSICNNLNERINGTIEISWNNPQGINMKYEVWSFNLSGYHPPVLFNAIDWIHLSHLILILTITVKTVGLIVSRSGLEIGPIVVFEPGYLLFTK